MKYAVVENNKITPYRVLPGAYHSAVANVIGGFNKLPDDELAKHGFFPVVEPTITDHLFQRKGNLYFDEANKVFTYPILETTHAEIDELKKTQYLKIDRQKKQLLEASKDEVFEALELGEAVPTEVSASRADIRTQAIKLKLEIETLNTQRDLLTYTGSITI